MKKIFYILLLVITLIVGGIVLVLKNHKHSGEVKVSQSLVLFKIEYDIELKNKKLIPNDFEYFDELTDEQDLIKNQKLQFIYNFFTISEHANFETTRTIFLMPKEEIETIKFARSTLTKEFFLSRGVTETASNWSVDIFTDLSKTYSECIKELKSHYKGTYNLKFFNEAIPRLIRAN
ncbi:hypothetical protein SCHIN_v1c06980 [Spiroplasma chinense]|uniref:Uncharacterized protein n=1 Tax=Spiroplasma chinense TaxID=216932 RepID=A0A5B9Y504_9MOLU|nr:hypothetical protein [Spiroplasma chinense]QEH61895.1 hypothetical protein SCHIN_v1c06980 [Spiroplasma chinense]